MNKFETFLEGLSNEQLQDLSKLTDNIIKERSDDETENTNDETVDVAEDFKVTRIKDSNNRKTPVKFKKNKWKDNGEFGDVETPNFEKTPRKRSKPNKRQVECHVCGREFSVNENLIYGEYHRCNRCTGR